MAHDRLVGLGIMIQGETGTGKSTIARWLHQQGPRAAEQLIESLQLPIDATQPMTQAAWLNPDFRFPAEGFSLESAIGSLIRHALQQSGNNVSAAARLLGVSRDYLRYRLTGKKGDV
jgi:DNA-binding NtrC family response regulator